MDIGKTGELSGERLLNVPDVGVNHHELDPDQDELEEQKPDGGTLTHAR